MVRADVEPFAVGTDQQAQKSVSAVLHQRPETVRQWRPHFTNVTMQDCVIENCGLGIHAENAVIDMTNTKFKGNGQNLKARNSVVRMRNTEAD